MDQHWLWRKECEDNNFYSDAEKWAVEEFARTPEGNVDYRIVYDLCPFVRIGGCERGAEALREYIADYGLEAARLAGRELRKCQPSQPPGVPQFHPLDAFPPVVRPPERTFGPPVNPRKLPPWKPFERYRW